MILGLSEKLDDKIILELSKRPNQTAQELTVSINKRDRQYSIQAIYKELRRLIADEVVVKNGPRFHLRLDWVTALSRFSESLFKKSMESLGKAHILPLQNNKKEWYVTGLSNVIELVAEIISLLESHEKTRPRFSYKPHQWPYLIGQKRFSDLKKKLHAGNIKK